MHRFKSDKVNAMIERIRSVDGVTFIPPDSWALDSQVRYEWKKFVRGGSVYAYREAKARAAARDEVKKGCRSSSRKLLCLWPDARSAYRALFQGG